MFLRTAGWLSTNYILLCPKRKNSSKSPLWEPQILHILDHVRSLEFLFLNTTFRKLNLCPSSSLRRKYSCSVEPLWKSLVHSLHLKTESNPFSETSCFKKLSRMDNVKYYLILVYVSDETFIFLSSLYVHQFLCVHYYMFRLICHHQVLCLLAKTAALYFNSLSYASATGCWNIILKY
jgi:hypothetical protein